MVLARVRVQRDYHRELTPEEQQAIEEDDADARRNHVPPTLRTKPNKEEVGTLDKEGYLIEVRHDGGYKWGVCIAVKTIDYGKPAKLDDEAKEALKAREHRLETLKKIGLALDRPAAEK